MQKQFRNLINPQENQPHSAFEKRIPRGQPGGWCPFDMGTTQGQRTPDSVGEVAACPRDMCCMGTASGGSTSRPTAAPSASGRLKGPFSVWPPRQILVCHSCQAARGQIPSRTSRVARAHCHGNPWPSTVSRSPTVRSCCGSGCSHTLGSRRDPGSSVRDTIGCCADDVIDGRRWSLGGRP
jgi:hypothetical protein